MSLSPKVILHLLVHLDGKSHHCVVVGIRGTLLYVGSGKQKCVSKSPMEAELVALLDKMGFAKLFGEFLDFMLCAKCEKPISCQDNTSVITLVTAGGRTTRTKHICVRM
jgi:hypothetical protein